MAHAGSRPLPGMRPDVPTSIITPIPTAMLHVRECKLLNLPYIYDPSQQTARITSEEICEGIDGCCLTVEQRI